MNVQNDTGEAVAVYVWAGDRRIIRETAGLSEWVAGRNSAFLYATSPGAVADYLDRHRATWAEPGGD